MNNQCIGGGVSKAQSVTYESNGLPSEIQELHQCIQDTNHAFAMLCEKISPVCRPDARANVCSEPPTAEPPALLSPIEEQVRVAHQQLNSIRVAMLQLHGQIAL